MNILPPANGLASSVLREATTNLRARLTSVSEEAVTGRRSDLTAHLGGRIGSAMLSQKAVEDINLEREGLTLRQNRLDIVQRTLSGVQDNVAGLSVRMLSAVGVNDTSVQSGIARDARGALEDMFSALNVRHGERYLFSGDATSTQPFGSVDTLLSDVSTLAAAATDAADFAASLDTYFNTPAGGFQTNIYSGSANASDADAVTGIDPAITQLISGLAVLALASPTGGTPAVSADPDILRQAGETLATAETSLTNLRADQGARQGRYADRLETLNAEETILTLALNEMTNRDQFEAAAELQELERNLEASYLLTNRLSNLSLLNYLR